MKTLFLFLLLCSQALAANYYLVTQPLTVYTDSSGKPLQNGYIYFGAINQNPQTVPITMTWDAAGQIPAVQPLRTINGYIARQGTPANIYAPSAYSISVQNSLGALIFNNPNSLVLSPQTAGSIGLVDAGNYYPGNTNVEAAFQVLGPLIAQVAAAFANNQFVPTGTMVPYAGITTAPTGWLIVDGLTIGNASSGAGGADGIHNSAATAALFTLLWNSTADNPTFLQIQDSGGSGSTRGASASVDYGLNKRLPLPDAHGRVFAGVGGTRITVAGGNFDGTLPFNTGGLQNHALVLAELANHNHTATVTDPGHTHTFTGIAHSHSIPSAPVAGSAFSTSGATSGGSSTTGSTTAGGTNASSTTGITVANTAAGSGTAHTILQPTIVSTMIIKL